MKHIQEKVKIFCNQNKLNASVESRALDIMSEVGELSKEILLSSDYGNKKIELNDKIRLELGDVLFSFVAMANSFDVDLYKCLNQVLEKYQERINKGLSL